MARKTRLVVSSCAAAAALFASAAAAQVQTPLPASSIPQFVQPLPTLSVQGGSIETVAGSQIDPILNVEVPGKVAVRACEFDAAVLPPGTPLAAGAAGTTRVWGYSTAGACPAAKDTYIGPVIVAKTGLATEVTWSNELGTTATSRVLAQTRSTDQTLHWADPGGAGMAAGCVAAGPPPVGSFCSKNFSGAIPMVPHLHGGEIPAVLDGGPDAWFTSDGALRGPEYYSFAAVAGNQAVYRYPNTQQGAPLWFHDHVLGITRLNVYAGLAGAYYIDDPAQAVPGFPVSSIVPLVIQDRMFDTSGQLFFPAGTNMGVVAPNPDHPYWVPEFTGDALVVNGKAYPYLQVQPKRYRFLVINGSNARTYELSLQGGPSLWVIGNDGGLLERPVRASTLTVMPGERYEVIVDFAGFKGNLTLRNQGRTPFPKGPPPKGQALTNVMQFRVAGPAVVDTSYNPATAVAPLRTLVRLTNPATGVLAAGVVANKTRQLTLNEVLLPGVTAPNPIDGVLTKYAGGPVEILVNNTKWAGSQRPDFTQIINGGNVVYYSELPTEGETEVWEIVNTTADAHPIHLHLVQFQILNRQPYQAGAYFGAYSAAFPAGVYVPGFGPPLDYTSGNPRALGGNPDVLPFLQGATQPPGAHEAGWKDTVMVPPGMVTRLAVRYAPTALPVNAPAAQLAFPFDPNDNFTHGYVWHCHIIDHEDNEMMRPVAVQLNPAAPIPVNRPLVKGSQY